jgi:hypothetical protein
MKKNVLIVIVCIALLSVIFIGFFGVAPVGIVPTTYIESLNILDKDGQKITTADSNGEKTMVLPYETNITKNDTEYMQYFFSTEVNPSDCTLRLFDYSVPENNYVHVQNSRSGGILIKKMELKTDTIPFFTTEVTVKASDGGKAGVEDKVLLTVKYGDMIVWD